MVAYYLQMQPHLFKAAVEAEFSKIKGQREEEEQQEEKQDAGTDLVLYR